jgi:uncharacterized membrane-anchored protein YhcB (DUF1043 family)
MSPKGERMNEIVGFAAVIVSIFAGILLNNARLNKLEEKVDARFNEVDRRFERMQAEINSRFERMQAEINGRFDRIQQDLIVFYRDLGRHDAKIEGLEKKAG